METINPHAEGNVGLLEKHSLYYDNHKDSDNLPQNQDLSAKSDGDPTKYTCIGGKYFVEVVNYDVKGKAFLDNIPIIKESIVDRFGRSFLNNIPYYETHCIVPSHTNYQPIIGRCINRYYPLIYTPTKGDHPTWDILMRRVFGEQSELGLDYLSLAYRDPLQMLPVLCLVSPENGTGKTSLGNAVAHLFGRNVGFCSQEDLSSKFNTWIKHLITVFEEISETKTTVNKIKNMSTAKSATLDEKYLPQITLQPFVKIIILSNNDRTFIKANEQDIRYWVRKLEPIPSEEFIPNFDELLEAEAPAMLHTLATRKISTTKKSRMWFDPALIATQALGRVRKESRSEIVQDLEIVINELLQDRNEFYTTPTELAEHLRPKVYSVSKITSALQNELGYKPQKQMRFTNLNGDSKNGTPYHFTLSEELRALKRESCEAEVPDDCLPY